MTYMPHYGAFVKVWKSPLVGKRCKISSHTFICEGVHIEDNCFIGDAVRFINDIYPHATRDDGTPQSDEDWSVVETLVRKGASVGSGAVILGGLTIGEKAIVGAGAVVTKDVPPRAIVAGNPARVLRSIDDGNNTKRAKIE